LAKVSQRPEGDIRIGAAAGDFRERIFPSALSRAAIFSRR
jgi:hypothetical protein